MSLFSAVSSQDMQTARIVTGLTMAAFIGIGFVPALRQRAALIRGILVAVYFLACVMFIGYVLMR